MKRIKKIFLAISLIFCLTTLISCSKPGDATVQNAMEFYKRQNYSKALELFNQALTEETNYSDELLYNFIANLYMADADFENANIYLEKLLETKPDYRMFVQLGRNYRELNDNENAKKSYQKAIDLIPNKGEAYASLGVINIAENDFVEAIKNLKKASELEPKLAVIHANLAVAYSLSGDKSSAAEEFKIAEELKCENLDEFMERAGM